MPTVTSPLRTLAFLAMEISEGVDMGVDKYGMGVDMGDVGKNEQTIDAVCDKQSAVQPMVEQIIYDRFGKGVDEFDVDKYEQVIDVACGKRAVAGDGGGGDEAAAAIYEQQPKDNKSEQAARLTIGDTVRVLRSEQGQEGRVAKIIWDDKSDQPYVIEGLDGWFEEDAVTRAELSTLNGGKDNKA